MDQCHDSGKPARYPPRELEDRAERDLVARVRASRRSPLHVGVRVGRILHEECCQLVDAQAAQALRLRQRIPGIERDALVEPAADAEVDAVELALTDAHVHPRVRRVKVEIRIAPAATIHASVQVPTHAEIGAFDVDVIDVDDSRRRELVGPAGRNLARPRLTDPRRRHLRSVERPVRVDLVLARDVGDRLTDGEEGPVGILNACRPPGDAEDRARAALRAEAWEEDGGVGVAKS